MWFLGRGWGRLGLGKFCRPWVPLSLGVGLTLTSEQKVCPLPGDPTEGLGRFQPQPWRVSGSVGQPSLPGARPTGHSQLGRWRGWGRCLVQAPHLLCPWGLLALLCGPVRLGVVKSLAEVPPGMSRPCSVGDRPPLASTLAARGARPTPRDEEMGMLGARRVV